MTMSLNKSICIAAVMAAFLANGAASAYAETTPAADTIWTISKSEASVTITGYSGPGGNVVCPSTWEGLPVTEIGAGAFEGVKIAEITLPRDLTIIGYGAFKGCGLKNIDLPASVEEIGTRAFDRNDLSSIDLSHVRIIRDEAFYENPLSSVVLPAEYTQLSENAFSGASLKHVNIPDTWTKIPSRLFRQAGVQKVTIPSSVTSIGPEAFMWGNLKTVTIPKSVTSIDIRAFAENPLTSVYLEGRTDTSGMKLGSAWNGKGEVVYTPPAEEIRVKNILCEGDVTVTEGQKQKLNVTVQPANAFDKSVSYQSQNTGIATVSAGGEITGKSAGETQITIKAQDGSNVSKTVRVTVTPAAVLATGITCLDKLSIKAGASTALNASVTPANATDKSLSYQTSDPSVAEVSSTGEVAGRTAGNCEITISTQDGSGVSKTVPVTVSPAVTEVTAIDCPDILELKAGEKAGLNAAVRPADATDKSLSYQSSDPSVAEVSSTGEVTGRTAGSCEITISAQDGSGVQKTVQVTVKETVPPAEEVTDIQCPGNIQVEEGKTVRLDASALPSSAADKALSFISAHPQTVSVSADGQVTGLSAGTGTIEVKAAGGKVSKNVQVEVLAASPAVPEDSTAEIPVEGEVKPVTTINVDVPVNVSFVIDEDRKFITAPFEIINHSAVPVTVKAVSLKAEGQSAKVTAEDAYTDKEWNNLSAADTQSKIALGLETLADSNLLGTADASPIWFASEDRQTAMKLGTIESAFEASQLPKLSMEFVSKYGKAWDGAASLRYRLVLEYSVE